MNYRGTENIEINERKFSLEYIYHMFRKGRIYFPMRSSGLRTKIEKELEQLLDAIWMGIPLPAIYASEQQNGDLLILEKYRTLYMLMNRFIYTGMWHDGTEMQEQLLLEETLKITEWQGTRINELLDKTHDFADFIFYMDDVYKNRISKKTRNNIWNKYLGLFVCLLDIAKRRKADREYMEYTLLERGVFYGISPVNVGTGVSYIAEVIISALSCKHGDVQIRFLLN